MNQAILASLAAWRQVKWDGCAIFATHPSSRFVDPRGLNCFENFLPAVPRIIVEPGKRAHPVVEIREPDGRRINVGMGFHEGDRNVAGVDPFHRGAPGLTCLPWRN